jgi:small subunit ribosomal protein S17
MAEKKPKNTDETTDQVEQAPADAETEAPEAEEKPKRTRAKAAPRAAATEPDAAEEKPKPKAPAKPRVRKPKAEEPVADEPPVEAVAEAPGEPAAEPEPVVAEAPAEEPVAEEPVAAEPEPEPEEAPAEEPVAEEPAAAEPAAEAVAAPPAPVQPTAKPKRKRVPRSERRTRSAPKRETAKTRKPLTRRPKPEGERGRTQERRGVVVSSAMDKTIVVRVDTLKSHTRYKKIVRRSSKLHAHDEQNQANVGDTVRIVESRPLSKTKHWRLAEILEVAK